VTSYLLDTHVWLWLQTTPERLGDEVSELLADRTNTLLLSAASGWEIAIKY
jgi:PIN domain nuclease of toxin-antitoxin system